jgi:Tol biopolymer transport system component
MTLAAGSRLGPYEITAKLGEGGMGVVWKAKDSHLGREVALKVLPEGFTADPERLARFEREAKLLAQLNHPNIAQVHGLEVSGETRALVMELVEGPTLAERLEAGPLPLDESLAIARQIAEALEEAHEKGIIHRDLKPQNIKASLEGKVKVLDFGLAKATDPAGAASSSASQLAASPTLTLGATVHGVILGSAAYMAPEQAKGAGVDKRADIWAFGVVLYEMLVGRRLFAGDSVPETLAGVLKTEIDFDALPDEAPPAIRRLLRNCLERNPKNRLHDIADARIALEELLRPGGEAATVASPSTPARGGSRREWVAWAVAAVAAIAAVATWIASPSAERSEPAGTTRFSVVPAEKGAIEGYPALSPDGRTLVYALLQEDGSTVLWAHSFDAGTSRRLPGTDDGQQPFWSPDGKQLGFFAAAQLKRLDLATGLTQSLSRAGDPRGGSWTDDGDILISVTAASPILRVSTSSGESRPATQLAAASGEQSHRYPWALPGGGFLFTSLGVETVQGIYWQGGEGGSPRRLTPDVVRAAYDERGFLVWVRDGLLIAQRFDPARGELAGDLIPLAENVGADPQKTAESHFACSAGGALAYRSGATRRTELLWFDRSGDATGALATPAAFVEPTISPDGRWVAVDTAEGVTSGDLWIFEASTLDRSRRLTFGAEEPETPIWSPDGHWLAYSSPRANGWALLRKPSDGSGEEELLYEPGGASWIDSWSPDGKSLLFERYPPDRGADLWILPLEGERRPFPYLESAANEAHGAFSPDGRLVAYTSDEGGLPEIYVQTVPASGGRWQISRDGGDWPAWRADGAELFYVGLDRTLRAVPVASLAPFSFGTPQPLFRLRTPQPAITSHRTYFAATADGQRFLVNSLLAEPEASRIDVVMNWSPAAQRKGG